MNQILFQLKQKAKFHRNFLDQSISSVVVDDEISACKKVDFVGWRQIQKACEFSDYNRGKLLNLS